MAGGDRRAIFFFLLLFLPPLLFRAAVPPGGPVSPFLRSLGRRFNSEMSIVSPINLPYHPPIAKVMELENALGAARFLDELSLSVKKIIFGNFPNLSVEEKEEIDQDVKLKILKMAAGGKKIGNFRSYVWKMVYSTALDVIARRSPALCLDDVLQARESPVESFVDTLSPEYLFEEKELLALTVKAIDALPSRRKAAVLCHLQGLSLEETAVYLGESLNAARHLLYRGLEEVKGRISERSEALIARRRKKARAPKLELKRT